jgi:acylphosphatase
MPRQLKLSGRVQGVNCRYYCSQYGKKLGLRGAASNMNDGRVLVLLATDDETKVRQYVEALRTNPLDVMFFGRITDIDVSEYSGVIAGDYNF